MRFSSFVPFQRLNLSPFRLSRLDNPPFPLSSDMFRLNQGTPNRFTDMQRVKPPEAPLAPYMKFSQMNWQKIRHEHMDRPLWEVSKLVAHHWRQLSDAERKEYHVAYEQERIEYEKTLRNIQNAPQMIQQTMIQKRQRQSGSRRHDPNNGVVIQPVVDEDPYETTPKKVAALRFERNQRLMLELFNGVPLPDVRSFIAPSRIEAQQKQIESMDTHRKRIADELARIEEGYIKKKKAIEDASKRFQIKLEKTCKMRPVVDERSYAKMVEKAEKQLLAQWAEYQRRQAALKQAQEAERNETPILYSLTVSPLPPASNNS